MNKQQVKKVQYQLRKVLNISLSIDGDYGPSTTKAVKRFQFLHNLVVDGIAGTNTRYKLSQVYQDRFELNSPLLHFGKARFVVFVDAGHGGIDESGRYVTAGKRAYHKTAELHERGHYYEGFENRLAAEAFIEECTNVGIMCVRTYHPYKDWSLSKRTEIVRSWLRRGYYGYLHSFHSNAISSKNSPQKLTNTVGYMVFSTLGDSFSDQITEQHFKHVKQTVGSNNWNYRTQRKDGDSDHEANFQMLRETDLLEFMDRFGAILDEWGFHSSSKDAQFIVHPDTRTKRVQACLKTAIWVKNHLDLKNAAHD